MHIINNVKALSSLIQIKYHRNVICYIRDAGSPLLHLTVNLVTSLEGLCPRNRVSVIRREKKTFFLSSKVSRPALGAAWSTAQQV